MRDTSVTLLPRKIAFGFSNGVRRYVSSANRTIILSPVIETFETNWGQPKKADGFAAMTIVVSGRAPDGVIDNVTNFSFETRHIPLAGEDPYNVRWYYEHVEWKDMTKEWRWEDADWIWDNFVSDRMSGEWPKPIEFLGVARMVDHGPSDPSMQDMGVPRDESFCGGFYRIPVKT